jgi:hypothetical protein
LEWHQFNEIGAKIHLAHVAMHAFGGEIATAGLLLQTSPRLHGFHLQRPPPPREKIEGSELDRVDDLL